MLMSFETPIQNSLATIFRFMAGGGWNKFRVETEQQLEMMRDRRPGKRPPRNSRDTQVLLCTLAGIAVGITIGIIVGRSTLGDGGTATGSIVGFVVGGIAGSFVGDYLKKRKYKKLERLAKKLDEGNDQGPFIS